jgi:histidine triad (HIT) family protein
MADGCPFCAAAAGGATTPVVYEGTDVFALVPLRPAALGHTLAIPRRHVPDLFGLDAAEAVPLTEAVLLVAHAIRRSLRPDGLNVITSAGAAATQTVPHLHVHLVPRWEGDAFGDLWPRPSPPFPPGAVEDAAAAIRSAIGGGPAR